MSRLNRPQPLSMMKLLPCDSNEDLKSPQKSLDVIVEHRDEMTLEFVQLFTDNFVNGSGECCRSLNQLFEEHKQVTFQKLLANLNLIEPDNRSSLAHTSSDKSYVFRFLARSNHIMLVLDVSPYMYRYDFATKCFSIQNLEDVLVLLFRLLLTKKEQTPEGSRLYLSVYGYSLDCSELFIVYELQEVSKECINELLNEAQAWLRKRNWMSQTAEGSAPVTRISDHIQQVLDRIRAGKMAHRMLVLSNFHDMPDSPVIFFPSGWCTFGFVLVGDGNFGTERIDEERVKEHYPSGEVFKMRHFFTAKFIQNCDKVNIKATCKAKLTHFQKTTYKERNLLFLSRGEYIEDIFERLMVFELVVERKRPAELIGQYNRRDVIRQYSLPADNIMRVLKSRYMEGWEPFHSGALALNCKAYCFRMKIDRFTDLVYSAIESDNKYVVKLSMEKNLCSLRYRRILEHPESNNVVLKEIGQLEQIDVLLTSDFSSFRPKINPVNFGGLLDCSSELEVLLRQKFRDSWSIFFRVERLYLGVFKADNKTQKLFIAALSDIIGKWLDFRVYFKQLVGDDGDRKHRKGYRKGVLTLFIKHNRNCLELRMGFLNTTIEETNEHVAAFRSKLRTLDLGDSIVREVPEMLLTQEVHPGQFNRVQVEYQIKAGTELVYKWLEKHIVAWRLSGNFYFVEPGLYVKIKNVVDVNGHHHKFCIYYSIRKNSEFVAQVTVYSSPKFSLVRRLNGDSVSCKQLVIEYGQSLKTREQGLCRLLSTYMWIHRELISHNDIKIIGRMLDRLSAVHFWRPTYSGFESELQLMFENVCKTYSHIPVTKETLHALPAPDKFLIDSASLAEVGLNLSIAGQTYQAILLTPLIPIILQVRDNKTYYRIISLPQEEADKELQLLDEALHLLQEDIRYKAYLQTYVDKFSRKEGGDWIRNLRQTSIDIGEFFQYWNTPIECDVNCHYFQFRRSYIHNVKESFQHAFMELMSLLFDLSGNYFFQKPFSPRSFRENQTTYIAQRFFKLIPRTGSSVSKTILRPFIAINQDRIPVENGDLVGSLDAPTFKLKLDGSVSIRLVLSYTTLEESGLPSAVNFLVGPLDQIFKEFILDFKRLDPKMLKEEEKCMGMVRSILPIMNSLNNMREMEYKFDLIENSKPSSQRKLIELMKTPPLCRIFTFCPVNQEFLFVHLLYLNSKNEEKGVLHFQNRAFQFSEFRKHIIFFIPFWLTLEVREDTIQTKLLVAPFNETKQINSKSLQFKIDRYVSQLFELANLNVLVGKLRATNNCPSEPYELYINETTSKILKQKAALKAPAKPTKKSKQEIRFAARKDPPPKLIIQGGEKEETTASSTRHFKMPLLYRESIPLYERFQEGQGLENIAQDQFWNSIEISNLQDTYHTPFRDDILIFHFSEVPVGKAEPEQLSNIEMFPKCKNLLVYSVYCTNTELRKSDVETTFRQNIINAHESKIVEKASQFLIRSTEVTETELGLITKGVKHQIWVKLPYLSGYGIYLSYFRQALSFIHKRTTRRLNKDQQPRSDSRNNSLITRDAELEYGDKDFEGEHEYNLSENDQMLFMFCFHRSSKSKACFGKCIYLLELFLTEGSRRLETISQSFHKETPKKAGRRTKNFLYSSDPRDEKHTRELQEITKKIAPAYQRSTAIFATPEPRRSSARDSTTDEELMRACEYRRLTLEFEISILGEAAYDKIKSYLERMADVTLEDYLIETVISNLRRSIKDEAECFNLGQRHKKSMDHDDMEHLHKQNVETLTSLQFMTTSAKSLSIMKCGSNGWDFEHCNFMELYHSVVKEVMHLLTDNSAELSKYAPQMQMLYYFVNQDRKPVTFGNYWERYADKTYIDSLDDLDDSDTLQGQIGIILGEHLIDELGQKNDEATRVLTPWITKIKRFGDGKFFSNDCLNFKRHFLLKISLNRRGIDLFTYNLEPVINEKLHTFMLGLELWALQRKAMKDLLISIKEKRPLKLSRRASSYVRSVTATEVLDELEDKKEEKRPTKGLQLSVTALMKRLITEVMPPIDNSSVYMVNRSDTDIIYKIIEDEKIDFDELPEPKQEFKGILHKLGFQVMSVIRKRYLMRSQTQSDGQYPQHDKRDT